MSRFSRPLPSIEAIRALVHYCPETGALSSTEQASIYTLPDGYIQIYVRGSGEQYLAHRIAWKLMIGRDPVAEIDHIDSNPGNNRWANLREATSSENNRNRKISRRNKSGVKGICWESSRRKWRATIGSDQGVSGLQWIGRFDDLAEAAAAIEQKRIELHGKFAREA